MISADDNQSVMSLSTTGEEFPETYIPCEEEEQSILEKTLFDYLNINLKKITDELKIEFPSEETKKVPLIDSIDYLINVLKSKQDIRCLKKKVKRGDTNLTWCLLVLVKCSAAPLLNIKMGASATNAMTALNLGRFNFSGKDLSGIQVKRANLTRGLLHYTDLSSSDLSKTNLSEAYLAHANLSDATLRKIYWGQEPTLMFPPEIKDRVLIKCICSPDGQWIASCTSSALYLWRVKTCSLQYSKSLAPMLGKDTTCTILLFSSDTRQLIIANGNPKVVFSALTASSGEVLNRISHLASLGCYKDTASYRCNDMAFYNEKLWGVYTSWDGKNTAIYEFESQNIVWSFNCFPTIEEPIVLKPTLHLSTKAAWLMIGSSVWNLLKQTEVPAWELKCGYHTCRLNAEKGWLAAVWDSFISIWEINTQQRIGHFKPPHTAAIKNLAFSTDGQWLASSSKDSTLHVWNCWDKCTQGVFYTRNTLTANILCFHPYEPTLIVAENSVIYQWRLGNLSSLYLPAKEVMEGEEKDDYISDPILRVLSAPLKLMVEPRLIAVDFSSKPIKLAWLNNKEKLHAVTLMQEGNPSMLISLGTCDYYDAHAGCLSSGGDFYAHAAFKSHTYPKNLGKLNIEIWEIKDKPVCTLTLNESNLERLDGIAIAPKRKILAVSGIGKEKGIVLLWDIDFTRLRILKLLDIKPYYCLPTLPLTFSADGQFLFCGVEGKVSCCDVQALSATFLVDSFASPEQPLFNIRDLYASLDGQQLAIIRGGVIEVWDAHDQKKKTTLRFPATTKFTGFSADGRELINVYDDNLLAPVWRNRDTPQAGCSIITWRKQSPSQDERFILNSDVPKTVGFYGEGIDIHRSKELSFKDKLFLKQQGAIGIEEPQSTETEDVQAQLTESLTKLTLEPESSSTSSLPIGQATSLQSVGWLYSFSHPNTPPQQASEKEEKKTKKLSY